MTQEQFKQASELLNDLKTLTEARDAIKANISMRESQMTHASPFGCLYEWLHKCAGRFILKGSQAGIAVRAEAARTVEFEVDEGFIGTVLLYLEARIDEKTKELNAL